MCARLSIDQNDSMPLMWILVSDPLANAVLDRVPIGEGRVGLVLVGVDHRIGGGVSLDESSQGRPVYTLDHGRPNAASGAVLYARYSHLVSTTAASELLPLRGVHVLRPATHKRLIGLHWSSEPTRERGRPRLTNSVQHEPSRLLRDLEIAVELHARHALERREAQVDADSPLPQLDFRALHRRPGADAEVAPAIRAPVGHPGVRRRARVHTAAVPAAAFARPQHILEPRDRGVLCGKHVRQVDKGEALAVTLSRCFSLRHDRNSLPKSTTVVNLYI